MIMEITDPYQPCPCGSGKKFKFCCRDKQRARESEGNRPALYVLPPVSEPFDMDAVDADTAIEIDESMRHCQKGLKLMQKSHFNQAIPWFRKAIETSPIAYTAANNLAICLFVTGALDEAIQAQTESLNASPFLNPFGLANLSSFHLIAGDEDASKRRLKEALDMELPSADACVKICEVLARYKRHKDIIELADQSGYTEDPGVCFYTGVASANLGKYTRAQTDLRHVRIGHHRASTAQRYLQHLQEKSAPHTVLGDWPYLSSFEVCPFEMMKAQVKADETGWNARRIAVQACEALLNEMADDPLPVINMFTHITHPDATLLLWAVVSGSFGSDDLRIKALSILKERGVVKSNQKVEMLLDGKRRTIHAQGAQLNPELRFGGQLPDALEQRYTKALNASQRTRPNWEKIGAEYQFIMREAPAFFPAHYNYAISLLHRKRTEEAEAILGDLLEQHPAYLFAPATLLQIYTMQDRTEAAEALIKSVQYPDETHPAAMLNWTVAQALYYEQQDDVDQLHGCIEIARQIAPGHPTVKRLMHTYK